MTFQELVREIALSEGVSYAKSRRFITAVFDEIAEQSLAGERVVIPQFGVFASRVTEASTRPVGGIPKKIAASKRVVFRVSEGAKVPLR